MLPHATALSILPPLRAASPKYPPHRITGCGAHYSGCAPHKLITNQLCQPAEHRNARAILAAQSIYTIVCCGRIGQWALAMQAAACIVPAIMLTAPSIAAAHLRQTDLP